MEKVLAPAPVRGGSFQTTSDGIGGLGREQSLNREQSGLSWALRNQSGSFNSSSFIFVNEDEPSSSKRTLIDVLLIFFLVISSCFIGIAVGLIHLSFSAVQTFFGIGEQSSEYSGFIIDLRDANWMTFVFLSIIFSVFVEIIFYVLPDMSKDFVKGNGLSQVLIAVDEGLGIPFESGIIRFMMVVTYLALSGVSLGIDGPVIMVCVSVMTCVGSKFGMYSHFMRHRLVCFGLTAGWASTFNSTASGICFGLETVLSTSGTFASFIALTSIAGATANVVKNLIVQSTFATNKDDVYSSIENISKSTYFLCIPIGILCGLLGCLCITTIRFFRLYDVFNKHGMITFTGIVTAIISHHVVHNTELRFMGIWGSGIDTLTQVFREKCSLHDFIIFFLCKFFVFTLAMITNCPGGHISPVIVIGSFIGGITGTICTMSTDLGDPFGVQIICMTFGVAGFFNACFRLPVTSVLLVLEIFLHGNSDLMIPTILCSYFSGTVCNRLRVGSINDEMNFVFAVREIIDNQTMENDQKVAKLVNDIQKQKFEKEQKLSREASETGTMSILTTGSKLFRDLTSSNLSFFYEVGELLRQNLGEANNEMEVYFEGDDEENTDGTQTSEEKDNFGTVGLEEEELFESIPMDTFRTLSETTQMTQELTPINSLGAGGKRHRPSISTGQGSRPRASVLSAGLPNTNNLPGPNVIGTQQTISDKLQHTRTANRFNSQGSGQASKDSKRSS